MNETKLNVVITGYDEKSHLYKARIQGVLKGYNIDVTADYTPNDFIRFKGQGAHIAKKHSNIIAAHGHSALETFENKRN